MRYAVVLFKVHKNSATNVDFRFMLRCACDHTPFLLNYYYKVSFVINTGV